MERSVIPDASAALYYDSTLLSTREPLWLCLRQADTDFVGANAASLRPGSQMREAAAFLTAFPGVVLMGGSQQERRELAEELRAELPALKLWNTPQSAYEGAESVEGLWEKQGRKGVEALWRQRETVPPAGVLDLAQVEPGDSQRSALSSGLPTLDFLLGGFAPGELTVWTGLRKEGKSTLLGLPILAALRAGERVCVYSGELSARRFRRWLLSMAAGPRHLHCRTLPSGRRDCTPEKTAEERIDAWWRGRIFLVDGTLSGAGRAEKLLEHFENCRRLCGVSVFVVDNLMSVDLGGGDLFQAQSRFVGQLQEFARRENVHVHLTAHCRKNSRGGSCDDVSGSGDITNRADNILRICRAKGPNQDAVLTVLDNREYGARGDIPLRFDAASRRFYEPAQGADWPCGWEDV